MLCFKVPQRSVNKKTLYLILFIFFSEKALCSEKQTVNALANAQLMQVFFVVVIYFKRTLHASNLAKYIFPNKLVEEKTHCAIISHCCM